MGGSFRSFEFTLEDRVRKLFQMLHTLIVVGLIFAASTAFTEEPSAENLFQKALAAYQNKQFNEARESFQVLLDRGLKTPELLHNLALTNYRLDQKPMALALWRRALTVDAGFQPARAGRSFVEMELGQRSFERDRISQLLRGVLEYVSLFEALWVMALLCAMTGWLWIRFFGERQAAFDEERPLPQFPSGALILSFILLSLVTLTAFKARQEFRTQGTIVGANVSARSLPADDGVGLFDLRGGAEVVVRRSESGWVQVQSAEGSSGWVKDSELFITSSR